MDYEQLRPPNSVGSTSASLLQRIQRGEEIAWRALLDLYGPIVAFWVSQSRLPLEDARDVCQEVFTAVALNIAKFERAEGAGKFRRWLKVITRHKISDHFRRAPQERGEGGESTWENNQGDPGSAAAVHSPDAEMDFNDAENAMVVQGILRIIQPEFQENTWRSFWLTAIEGLDSSQAATELGLSADAVRKNKSRVLARLRDALRQHLT